MRRIGAIAACVLATACGGRVVSDPVSSTTPAPVPAESPDARGVDAFVVASDARPEAEVEGVEDSMAIDTRIDTLAEDADTATEVPTFDATGSTIDVSDECDACTLLTSDSSHTLGPVFGRLAVDDEHVYFPARTTSGGIPVDVWIARIPKTGGTPVALALAKSGGGQTCVTGMDLQSGNVVWTQFSDWWSPHAEVARALVTGGSRVTLLDALPHTEGLGVSDGRVVFTSGGDALVMPLVGGAFTNFGSDVTALAHEGATVVWASGSAIRKASIADPKTSTVVAAVAKSPSVLTMRDGVVYWVADSGVMRTSVDAGVVETLSAGTFHPKALVANGTSLFLLDADPVTGPQRLVRIRLAGGASSVAARPSGALSLVADDTAVYWSDAHGLVRMPL